MKHFLLVIDDIHILCALTELGYVSAVRSVAMTRGPCDCAICMNPVVWIDEILLSDISGECHTSTKRRINPTRKNPELKKVDSSSNKLAAGNGAAAVRRIWNTHGIQQTDNVLGCSSDDQHNGTNSDHDTKQGIPQRAVISTGAKSCVLLSCSHVFHEACIMNFEQFLDMTYNTTGVSSEQFCFLIKYTCTCNLYCLYN